MKGRAVAEHQLKSWPDPFQAKWDGRKTAEFRKNDRDFHKGDILRECEWIPTSQGYPPPYGFTHRQIVSLVTDLRQGGLFGIPEDHCMMSTLVLYRVTALGEIPPHPPAPFLPDHWLFVDGTNTPPMPLRLGRNHPLYEEVSASINDAARYAIRACTFNGTAPFDPDALMHAFRFALIGYHSPDGLSDLSPCPDSTAPRFDIIRKPTADS